MERHMLQALDRRTHSFDSDPLQRIDSGGLRQTAEGSIAYPKLGQALNICVASSFTANPLLQPMELWLRTLEIQAEVCMAPYAQVMQELLDPQSSLALNKN